MDKPNNPAQEPKKRMGRPPVEVNWDKIDALLQCFGTLEECAAVTDCSVDTIENAVRKKFGITFSEYSRQKMGYGRASVKRALMQQALKGNMTAIIWLTKQKRYGFDMSDEQHVVTHDSERYFDLIKKMDDDK